MIDLRLGDCLDIMRGLPDGCVDAVITDPPYMDYATGRYDASAWHAPIVEMKPNLYMPGLFRVVKDCGFVILWCRWDTFYPHSLALSNVGFEVRNCIVWDKGNHTAGDLDGNLGYEHEQAVFAVKGNWKRWGRRETNVWRVPHLFSKMKRDHPTEKPVNLMKRSVMLARSGDTVLDPFMGSGTTGVACVKLNRNFIGIEINERYYNIAQKRIAEAQQQMVLL